MTLRCNAVLAGAIRCLPPEIETTLPETPLWTNERRIGPGVMLLDGTLPAPVQGAESYPRSSDPGGHRP